MTEVEQLSFTHRRWVPRRARSCAGAELETAYGRVVAQLLAARGVESLEEAERFLDPGLHRLSDPFALRGVAEAVERIALALERGERIAVYGDYDVDGQSAAALMVRVLTSLGAQVVPYIPHRTGEGYGLHIQALDSLAAAGCTLAITVDCGITAVEEAAWAAHRGLDLIITDHHEPKERLPGALALINPHLDPEYPHPYLAGCGVAFKLAEALALRVQGDRSLAHRYVELAALGTVADVVPLRGENRSLVRAGLSKMNGESEIPGIEALRRAACLEGEVTPGAIGFILAPRLNAAGRVGDPTLGLRLLLARSVEEATPLALALEECNAERRRVEEEVLEAARASVEAVHRLPEDRGIVVAGEGWHPGVVGIVAARLVEAYYRPALVLGIDGDVARGSGRSVPGFDLFGALSECASLFDAFGGHEAAAGFTLPAARIGELRARFLAVAGARLAPEDLVPALTFDAYIGLDELSFELLEDLAALEPHGVENPAPVFVTRGVRMSGRAVGKDGAHFKVIVAPPGGAAFDGIAFSMAQALAGRIEEGALYDVAFTPEVNVWNGRRSIQLNVKDVRLAEAGSVWVASGSAGSGEAAPAVGRWVRGAAADGWWARVRVEQARGRALETLVEEFLSSGWFVYVVPGPPERAEEVGRRLQNAFPAREAALFLAPPKSEQERRIAEEATARPPWAAVARFPLPGREVAGWRSRLAPEGEAGLAILVCDLPRAAGELLKHVAVAADWDGPVRCILAYSAAGVERTKEELLRDLPDRDRLAVAYLALRSAGARGATVEELLAAAQVRRPGALSLEGAKFALAVFKELGLVEPVGGRWRLARRAPAKVDLEESLRYNGGNARRMEFSSYAEALLGCPPGDFFPSLLGRGVEHGSEGAGA